MNNHKSIFSDRDYDSIYPTSASIPVLYGLPKIHKDGIPLRPILSMVGSFNHGFAKYLANILDPMRQSKNICRDSFSLCSLIGKSNLHMAYLVSYDVDSLFTNVPVDEVINIILDSMFPKGTSRREFRVMGFKRLDMERALGYCLKDNNFVFNGKLYTQIDGIAMGSPLAPILADIFLNSVFEPLITRHDE